MIKFARLSHQILAVFVAVVTLTLGLSGWAVTALAQRVVTDNVARGHQELARRIAEEIDQEVEDILLTLSQLAESADVRTMDPANVRSELHFYHLLFPVISGAYVADHAGLQIARTDWQPLEDVATIFGFQVARKGRELLSDVYLPQSGHGPTLTVYLPITHEDRVVGVLVADVDFARVQAILEGLALTRNETVVVFAPNGRAVAHSRTSELAELPALTDPTLIKTLIGGSSGVLEGYTDELDRAVLGVHAPASELGWAVVIQTPLEELAAEVAVLRRTMWGGLLGGVLLAMVAGWLMARRLAEPIGQLAQATGRVAAGDLGARSGLPGGRGELNQLAYAFDEMAEALQTQRAEAVHAAEALRRERDLAEALEGAAAALSATLGFEQVLDRILEQVQRVVPGDASNIMLIEDDEVHVARWRGYERFGAEEYISTVVWRVSEVPSFQRMVASLEPTFIPDTATYPDWLHLPAMAWLRSYAAVPIVVRDEVIGFLRVDSAASNFFSHACLEPLRAFADHAAAAIENARLFEQVQRHAVELEARIAAATEEIRQRADERAALYEVSRDLVATLDLEALLPAIAQRVAETLKANRCAIFLFDERAGVLRVRAAHGFMAERLLDFSYRPGEEVVGHAYATGETQYVPDLDQTPDLPRRDAIRTVLAVPLSSPTAGPLGALSVTSLRPRAFAPEQQQLLETMAGQIARAIESARLYQATERHAAELAVLHEVGKEITSTLQLDTMLQTIADNAAGVVRASKSLILLVDAEKQRLTRVVGRGYSRAELDGHTFGDLQDGISGWVLREKVPTLSADIQTDERNRGKARASARRSGDRSAAVAPLLIGGKVIGTLTVVNSQRARAFTPADLNLVAMLAAQAATAIQNARLYEAAQEADRLKSAFLATMSHELRTPLNSIIGFTGMLLMGLVGPLNDEQTKQLGMVRSSARHLLELINDVLDISKIEAGEVETVFEPFDVREAIEKVVQTVTPLAGKKGLALIAQVAPEVGQITSDRRRVEQILINLVNNAVKFTEAGQVTVLADLISDVVPPSQSETADREPEIRIQVVDTGIGIKHEDMEKLFGVFQQIDTGLTRQHEGTGLGLSICKKLVEMVGGEIWVESEWGVGSTFTFTLPERE